MAEEIDIFDANLDRVGQMERKQAHLEGHWHRTFHLWLASEDNGGSLLFQLRAPDVVNYPSMLDITAAGHLAAGESVEEGVREVREELGLDIDSSQIHDLGYRVEVADQDNGQRNREYQAVFLARLPVELDRIKPDPQEVYGLLALSLNDCFSLFQEGAGEVLATGIAYDAVSQSWRAETRMVSAGDFIPRIQRYYLTMSIMAERLLAGQSPLAVS